jgi:hypothetical protein
MYRVATACQGAHIVVVDCCLAWYLIYERRSQEPDDLSDGFEAHSPTDGHRHPENRGSILVRGRSGGKHIVRDFASKGCCPETRDSRFPVQNQDRPVRHSANQSRLSSEGSSTGRVGMLAIPPVRACIYNTHDFFCVKNNRGTVVPRFSW